jgi:hypothetical protein
LLLLGEKEIPAIVPLSGVTVTVRRVLFPIIRRLTVAGARLRVQEGGGGLTI